MAICSEARNILSREFIAVNLNFWSHLFFTCRLSWQELLVICKWVYMVIQWRGVSASRMPMIILIDLHLRSPAKPSKTGFHNALGLAKICIGWKSESIRNNIYIYMLNIIRIYETKAPPTTSSAAAVW